MRSDYKHDPQLSLTEGYELTDLNIRHIVYAAIVVGASVLLTVVLMLLLLRGLMDARTAADPGPASYVSDAMSEMPAGPHLQTNPVVDRAEIIGQAEAHLRSYGILTETPAMKRAYVPIERAIELLLEGEAPYRQEPVDARLDADAPPHDAAEPLGVPEEMIRPNTEAREPGPETERSGVETSEEEETPSIVRELP